MRYDLEYFEKMLRQNSSSAKEICDKRWQFLLTNIKHHPDRLKVLDYGSGVGWFRAWRPRQFVDVWTYDIADYPQTGVNLQVYDVVTMWDVLEHIPDFAEIESIFRLTDHVAVSVPMADNGLEDWKHFKPTEHLHYFTEDSLRALFKKYGFETVIMSRKVECPPREDILSALFRRRAT